MPLVHRAASVAAPLLALAALAGSPAAAAAQPAFEGVVTMRMQVEHAPQPMTMRYLIRQGRMRSETEMGGMQMATIVDPAKQEAYVLMPGQRSYMVMSLDAAAAQGAAASGPVPEVTRTGRTETVAGHTCEHVLVKVEAQTIDMCLATDMPALVMPGARMGPGARAGQAAWQRALGGTQLGFPLKVTSVGGTASTLEVTSIERKALDASLFEVPADFQRMQLPAGMPGAPRRP